MKAALLFILMIFCSSSYLAESIVVKDIKDLKLVVDYILSDKPVAGSTLVILDIDDTLLESESFIGSDKWYRWQTGKKVFDQHGKALTIKDNNRFLCIQSTLGTLFELATYTLTQQDVPEIVGELKAYDLMLLTARTVDYRGGTERELQLNGIQVADKHLLEAETGLEFILDDRVRSAKVTYQNGIVMSSGLNKGLVLKAILEKTGKKYQDIYFVDDGQKNIDNMKAEWKDEQTKVTIFHYTKVDKSISHKEIHQSIEAKKYFDSFLVTAFPERSKVFITEQCR